MEYKINNLIKIPQNQKYKYNYNVKQFFLIILLLSGVLANAQNKKNTTAKKEVGVTSIVPSKVNVVDSFKIKVDSLLGNVNTLLEINNILLTKIKKDSEEKERFKLYKTENIYTFLQLDTKTGKIEQIQWSLEEKNEGSFKINGEDLSFGFGYSSGSFELYSTDNMYQFILLDKTDGRKWHVQWGIGNNKRWIRSIY